MHSRIQILYISIIMFLIWIAFMFIVIISKTEHKSELHVEAFGLSVTTMEEVFIKVGEDKEETLSARYVMLHIYETTDWRKSFSILTLDRKIAIL